jgi:prolipoprotein diacylglyceryltransferase
MCYLCIAAAAAEPIGAYAISGSAPSSSSRAPGSFIVAKFVNPVLFTVFGLKFYSYGVFVAAACLFAFLVFGQELLRARLKIDDMNCFFIFLGGFGVGSKAHVVLSGILMAGGNKQTAWETFISFIDIRNGHSFMGSIIGASLALIIYARWNKVNILTFLDVLLPCCLLGHSIGRIGCFLSGDGCYGPEADPAQVPWAMSFPNGMVPVHVPVHPTPIYEMVCSFLVFAITRWALPFPPAPEEESENPEKKEITTKEGAPKKEIKKESASKTKGAPKAADSEKDSETSSSKKNKKAPLVCDKVHFPKVGRRTALLLVLYGIERVALEHYRRNPPVQIFGGLSEYQGIALMLLAIGGMIELYGKLFGSHEKTA